MPILMVLNISTPMASATTCCNYRKVDWNAFHKTLKHNLDKIDIAHKLNNADQLQDSMTKLCNFIDETINKHVPLTRPNPKTKRCWTEECTKTQQRLNQLGAKVHRKCFKTGHPIHTDFWQVRNEYVKLIERTKLAHSNDFIETAIITVWITQNYMTRTPMDGGRTKAPTLYLTDPEGRLMALCLKQQKGRAC